MSRPGPIRRVVVTVLSAAGIIALLFVRSQMPVETAVEIGLVVVVATSVWWKRLGEHPAFKIGMFFLINLAIFLDVIFRKGIRDFGASLSGAITVTLAFLFLNTLRTKGNRNLDQKEQPGSGKSNK